MEKTKDKHIFVAYVGVGNTAENEGIEKVMKAAYAAINPIFNDMDAEVIFIPTRTVDSKFECINPQYITEDELIRKNRLLMDELHEHLDVHMANLKNEIDKK